MARNPGFTLFFSLFMMIACMTGPFIAFASGPGETGTTMRCIQEVRVARAASPFKEWESRDTQAKRELIRAADLKAGNYEAIPSLARYEVSGQLLMGIERKTHEPVVSSKYFSPLTRVDATRIETGQKKEIGTFLGASQGAPGFRDVVLFLLESQAVETLWHVESILCLVSEDDSTNRYRAHLQGKHIYYTNRYNEGKLDFFLDIDKSSGRMFLTGG
jgi:hypothetical protein